MYCNNLIVDIGTEICLLINMQKAVSLYVSFHFQANYRLIKTWEMDESPVCKTFQYFVRNKFFSVSVLYPFHIKEKTP